MPAIHGPKNRRIYSLVTKRHDESRAFHTDTLLLRNAIAEYERHLDVTITPVVESGVLEPERLVDYRNNDADAHPHTSGWCCVTLFRVGEDSREIGCDFDLMLQPDDRIEFETVAC